MCFDGQFLANAENPPQQGRTAKLKNELTVSMNNSNLIRMPGLFTGGEKAAVVELARAPSVERQIDRPLAATWQVGV